VIASGSIGEPRILTINALKEQKTGDWRDDRPWPAAARCSRAGSTGSTSWPTWAWTVPRHGFRPGAEGPERRWWWSSSTEGRGRHPLLLLGDRLAAEGAAPLGAVRLRGNGHLRVQRPGAGVRAGAGGCAPAGPRDLLGYGAMFEDFFRAIRTGRSRGSTCARRGATWSWWRASTARWSGINLSREERAREREHRAL
jgi:hypothetical protein